MTRLRTVEQGLEHAAACWEMRLNCAESVLRGVCFAQEIEPSDQAKRMATPFGGGIGRSEDICGALAGGTLALGLMLGRTEPGQDRARCYDAAHKLYASFVGMFGAPSCKALNRSDFQSPEHRARCGNFVRESCRLAIEIVREK